MALSLIILWLCFVLLLIPHVILVNYSIEREKNVDIRKIVIILFYVKDLTSVRFIIILFIPPLILIYFHFSVFWAFESWCPFASLFDLCQNSSSVLLQQRATLFVHSEKPGEVMDAYTGLRGNKENKRKFANPNSKRKTKKKKPQTFQFYLSFPLRIRSFDKTFNPKQNQFSQAVAFTGICAICFPTGKSKHPAKKPLNLGFAA